MADQSNADRAGHQREIWDTKPTLRSVYADFHRRLQGACPPGPLLDIGGGSAHFKDYRPDVVSIDIIPFAGIDVVADAHAMPFDADTFNGVVMLDVLHHLQRPVVFMREAARILKVGGRLAMIEPGMSAVSKVFYDKFHHEPVDMGADPFAEAVAQSGNDPWDSNQAIPSLMFGSAASRARLAEVVPGHQGRVGGAAQPLRLSLVRRLQEVVPRARRADAAPPRVGRRSVADAGGGARVSGIRRVGEGIAMIDGVPFASRGRSGLAAGGRPADAAAEPAAIQPGRAARFAPGLTLSVLLTVFAVPNLVWVLLDRRVWPWDQAWYGEVTADLSFLFAHCAGSLVLRHALVDAEQAPSARLARPSHRSPWVWPRAASTWPFWCFVVALQTASLALIWTACRAVAPRNLPIVVAATLFAAAGPLFIGLSHQYLVEPLQILDVSASLFVAIRAPRIAGFRLLALLALLTIVGMGSKTTTFIYCGLFWAIAFGYGVQAARQRRWAWGDPVAWVALAAAFLLGIVTAGWYLANMADMLAHIRAATEGADAELYGHRGTLLAKLPFWWDAALTGFLVGWDRWILVFLPVAMAASAVLLPRGLWRRTWRIEDAVAFAASAHVVITILLLAGQPNEETRFLVPLAPDLAMLLAWV